MLKSNNQTKKVNLNKMNYIIEEIIYLMKILFIKHIDMHWDSQLILMNENRSIVNTINKFLSLLQTIEINKTVLIYC